MYHLKLKMAAAYEPISEFNENNYFHVHLALTIINYYCPNILKNFFMNIKTVKISSTNSC